MTDTRIVFTGATSPNDAATLRPLIAAFEAQTDGVAFDEIQDLPGADYAWVLALRPGDRVTWNDPPDGACSRTDTIKRIYFRPDFVGITWDDESDVEALYDELEESPDES